MMRFTAALDFIVITSVTGYHKKFIKTRGKTMAIPYHIWYN